MDETKSNDVQRKSVISKGFKSRHEEQGFVLIVGMVVMAILLLLAVPFLYQVSFENKLTNKSYKSSAAISLAEAGVDRAIWELNYGDISSWTGDDTLRTMDISSFQASGGSVIGDVGIKVVYPTADHPIVESRGTVLYVGDKKVVRTVRSELGGFPPFKFAAFGDDGIMIDRQVYIDSYDSRNGDYSNPGNSGSDGDIGTNSVSFSAIYMDNSSDLAGDAVSGYESDPESVIITAPGAHIDGEKRALTVPIEFPQITPPSGLLWVGDYSMSGTDSIFLSGQYGSFTMEANSIVTIEDDVILYITGDFYMDQNSRLDIADGASLQIIMGSGTFEMDQTSSMNNLSRDPTKLVLFGTESFTGDIYIDQNSEFYGAIYAPNAFVELDQADGFYGAIIANNVLFDQDTVLHYDKALEDLEILPSMGSLYIVKSWQIKVSD
ncbi:MAG: hypothetical protein GTN73_01340 [Candidatus Aminicenantes bacterium]|nr:hypothetical protein [Candidatus Aminicenantes bacterium]